MQQIGVRQTPLDAANGQPREAGSLFGRTASAITWRFFSETSRFTLQLVVMVILARLVSVNQFGLLAVAMVVFNIFFRVSELGLIQAVIQRRDLTNLHIRVAFTISVLNGMFFTTLIWVLSPQIAALFKMEAATPILRLISFAFILNCLGSTAAALLHRQLDYRNHFKAEMISFSIGYVPVSIALAIMGYGEWAIAWATIIHYGLRTFMFIMLSPHQMKPSISGPEARQLLSFGMGQSLSSLANNAAMNGDYFVVGRWLGATDLGLYSRAYQLMAMPLYQFTSVISMVLFPVYSIIQGDDTRLRRAYLSSVSLSAILVSPVLACLAVAAPEIMAGVFGPDWIGAAQPLAILCAGGVFQSTYALADSLARAKGAVYLKFSCHAIYAVCVFFGSLIGSRWGLNGVAAGVVIAVTIMFVLMGQLSIRLTKSTWKEFLLCQLPGVIFGVAVAAVAFPLTLLMRFAGFPNLAIIAGVLITSAIVAAIGSLLTPYAWLNEITFGAIDRIKQKLLETGTPNKIGDYLKAYLRRNRLAFMVALVPYRLYENTTYLIHIIGEGLWQTVLGLGRSALRREGQKELVWDVPFPAYDDPSELVGWLQSRGIRVCEGEHAMYLPPQSGLNDLIPSIVDFYPRDSGYKILRDFNHPARAKYLYRSKSLFLLMRLIGSPKDQLIPANYLYSLGIGSRVWDLTCWTGQGKRYTVFVVDHVNGEHPTAEQCKDFLGHLKHLTTNSSLRVLLPKWEKNEDFLPPHCKHNLLYSHELGRTQYIDFQNFGLTKPDAWSQELISSPNGDTAHAADTGYYVDAPKRCHSKKWSFITASLHEIPLSLEGRVMLNLGCDSGAMIRLSLAAGAYWGIGWMRPKTAARTQSMLLSSGISRFSLIGCRLHQKYRLEDDIPLRFIPMLTDAVFFYSGSLNSGGILESLYSIPWRALVYEGRISDRVEKINEILKPLIVDNVKTVITSYLTDDDGQSRPISILWRG